MGFWGELWEGAKILSAAAAPLWAMALTQGIFMKRDN